MTLTKLNSIAFLFSCSSSGDCTRLSGYYFSYEVTYLFKKDKLKFLKGYHNIVSDKELLKAIEHFQKKEGKLSAKAPMAFLAADEQDQVAYENGFNISLYKALLFRKISAKVKSGSLNLMSSYKFRTLDEYLIDKDEWVEITPKRIRIRKKELAQNHRSTIRTN